MFDDIQQKIVQNEQKRIESTELLKAQVMILDTSQGHIRDDLKNIRDIMSRLDEKFSSMHKELTKLAEIQVEDK